MRIDPTTCVPLRPSYDVFSMLKGIFVNGSEYFLIESPLEAFTTEPDLWVGGAATYTGEWMLFLSNGTVSDWIYVRDCSPKEGDAVTWRETLVDTLDTFYGFRFR